MASQSRQHTVRTQVERTHTSYSRYSPSSVGRHPHLSQTPTAVHSGQVSASMYTSSTLHTSNDFGTLCCTTYIHIVVFLGKIVMSPCTHPCVHALPFAFPPAQLATSLRLLQAKKGLQQKLVHPIHGAPPVAVGRQHPINKHLRIKAPTQHYRPLFMLCPAHTNGVLYS